MKGTLSKKQRVRDELVAAGMTSYGLSKSESIALPDHIGEQEHILAVVYGQHEGSSAMMVATDKRLLFLDVRAMHNMVEDSTYDVFGDLSVDEGIAFSHVTLRLKPKTYDFKLVNRRCARRFLNVVESMALDRQTMQLRPQNDNTEESVSPVSALPEEVSFLSKHYIATLSTRAADGYPYGATVFYFYESKDPDSIYVITKSSTTTAQNIRLHPKVAFTVTDFDTAATMHVLGESTIVKDAKKSQRLVSLLMSRGSELSKAKTAPVTQIEAGAFVVYKTHIHQVSLKSYL